MIKLTLPMPRLGETMDSGTIAGWNVAEGDSFERGDTLLELETDKTLWNIPRWNLVVSLKLSSQKGMWSMLVIPSQS